MARVFATKTEFSYFVLEQSLPKDDSVSTFGKESGKISAQPHTTLCIQFLTRENNEKTIHFHWENRFVFNQYVYHCMQ